MTEEQHEPNAVDDLLDDYAEEVLPKERLWTIFCRWLKLRKNRFMLHWPLVWKSKLIAQHQGHRAVSTNLRNRIEKLQKTIDHEIEPIVKKFWEVGVHYHGSPRQHCELRVRIDTACLDFLRPGDDSAVMTYAHVLARQIGNELIQANRWVDDSKPRRQPEPGASLFAPQAPVGPDWDQMLGGGR